MTSLHARGTNQQIGPFRGWIWPIPVWNERKPVISQGFNPAPDPRFGFKHGGVDIMFVRLPEEPAVLPEGVKSANPKRTGFFMPSDTIPALAAGPGIVIDSGPNPLGHHVKIQHEGGWVTFYQHLTADRLAPKGMPVPAGWPIGTVGNGAQTNPDTYPLNHLHFEIWKGGVRKGVIDPEPILQGFGHYPLHPGLALATR